jgi:DNA repair exonuclease SbcCD ATPase subunit
MSFGKAEISLMNCGYTLVSGTNQSFEDMAKSNGSGKSSIWEAVSWVLTGETIRGTKDVVNKFTEGGTRVDIEFELDKTKYNLVRTKEDEDLGTNLKIYVNGQDKSGKGIRDSEKLLEQLLPDITAQLIGSVVILGQGLPQRFSNNTPSGRKEVLEKLSKSDFMIEDIKEKLSKRKSELNEILKQFENEIVSIESKSSIYKDMLDKDNKELIELEKTSIIDITNEITQQEQELESVLLNIDTQTKEVELYSEKLDGARKLYTETTLKFAEEISQKEKEFEADLLQTSIESTKLSTEIKSLSTEIKKLESVKDTCPTCGQKLPDIHKVDTTELVAKHTELVEQLSKINLTLDSLERDKATSVKELKDKHKETLLDLEKQGKDIKFEYEERVNQLDKLNQTKSTLSLKLDKLKLNKDNHTTKIIDIKESIKDTENKLNSLLEKLTYNIVERDATKNRLEAVTKMTTIATRDFRGFLLSSIIEFISSKSKEYAKEIFDTDKITFKLDGNNIYIGYNDKQYENLSGGEKQKVDLIIQFAIRDMLSRYLDFSSNILVLDEIFDNLDEVGCQKVLNLISNKLVDIESIFIITHHTDISIPYDNELVIVKGKDNISRVQ